MTQKINYVVNETYARLLATENLTVVHKKCQTAGFDVKSRTLILPIFKNISENIYDLFIGHETSHALNTPLDQMKKVIEKSKDCPVYSVIVNLVEDARIEKMIKRKFPGLAKSFRKGYTELLETDFFGIKNKNVNKLNLGDRLNLHFKVGSLLPIISFTEEERDILDQIDRAETFEEVLKASDRLLEKLKEENQQKQNVKFELVLDPSDIDLDKLEKNKEDSVSKEKNKEEDVLIKIETYQKEQDNIKNFFDNNSSSLFYINFTEDFDVSKVIVDYKKIHSQIKEHYVSDNSNKDELELARKEFALFKNQNSSLISYLVKEFEMKKAAEEYTRTNTSKTGTLDLDRLYSYKYNEDIFLNKNIILEGKNHGLVMFVDGSSSMASNIHNTYEQLVVLVLFCRQANIPFEVYGFYNTGRERDDIHKFKNGFSCIIGTFSLRNYFSSRMSAIEFNEACINMQAIINYYKLQENHLTLPRSERLESTPLNEAAVCAVHIVNAFRTKYKIEKVTSIFLTDGESNPLYYKENNRACPLYNGILRDVVNKKDYIFESGSNINTTSIYNRLRDRTHSNIVGFYIISNSYIKEFFNMIQLNTDPKANLLREELAKNKSICLPNIIGYDELYLILDDGLKIEKDKDFVIEKKQDDVTIAEKFSSFLKGRIKNRIILKNFIEQIV